DILFNSTVPGDVTLTGGPTSGDISAGRNIVFNGGTGGVAANIRSIAGTINANGTGVSVETGAGNLVASAISATSGLARIVANGGAVSLANSGTVAASQTITLRGASGVTIGSGGAINAGQQVNLDSVNAGANININNTAMVTSTTAGIAVNSANNAVFGLSNTVSAGGGNLTVVAGGIVDIGAGDTFTASNHIRVTSAGNVTVGAPGGSTVAITAGQLGGGVDTSRTLADAAIPAQGEVLITSTAGTTALRDRVNLTSHGSSIILTGQNVQIGTLGNVTAYGGNIRINAAQLVSIPSGSQFTAIAQYLPGQQTFTIDNNSVRQYRGGGIAIFAGLPNEDLEQHITNLHLSRRALGLLDVSNNVNAAGSSFNYTNSGTVRLFTTGSGKIGAVNTSFVADGGVIFIDPPGDQIDIGGGAMFIARGPGLQFIPPPSPPPSNNNGAQIPPSTPPIIEVSSTTSSTSALSSPQTTQADKTNTAKEIKNIQPANPALNCSPMAIPDATESQEGSGYTVATGTCQPFSFEGGDGSAVVGRGGTIFAVSQDRAILLKEGRLVAIAGKQNLLISTQQGNIEIPSDGTVIVERKPSGVIRVANLAGSDTIVSIKSGQQSKSIAARTGEELVVADSTLSDEELIPVDGIEREPVGGAVVVSGVKIQKQKFNVQDMANKEALLLCNMGCFSIAIRKKIDFIKQNNIGHEQLSPQGTTNKIKAYIPANRQAIGNSNDTIDGTGLVPISFTQPTGLMNTAASGIRTLSTTSGSFKHNGRTKLGLETSGQVNLSQGETVIAAHKNVVIKSGVYLVSVNGGTIAWIGKEGNVLKVRNIWDTSHHAVKLYANNKTVCLSAGQEVVAGPDDGSVMKAMKSDFLGRRRIRSFGLTGSQSIVHSDFSLLSLAHNSNIVNLLLKSSNRDDRTIAQKLIKMSACLTHVTTKHGAYASVDP
ncbi:MAG: hypothetical protein HY711_03735, partial [Candidatus Melainabacteria bacterium]|nr:hypothetical protein [Candidatus Melainabacteria bacterium]